MKSALTCFFLPIHTLPIETRMTRCGQAACSAGVWGGRWAFSYFTAQNPTRMTSPAFHWHALKPHASSPFSIVSPAAFILRRSHSLLWTHRLCKERLGGAPAPTGSALGGDQNDGGSFTDRKECGEADLPLRGDSDFWKTGRRQWPPAEPARAPGVSDGSARAHPAGGGHCVLTRRAFILLETLHSELAQQSQERGAPAELVEASSPTQGVDSWRTRSASPHLACLHCEPSALQPAKLKSRGAGLSPSWPAHSRPRKHCGPSSKPLPALWFPEASGCREVALGPGGGGVSMDCSTR